MKLKIDKKVRNLLILFGMIIVIMIFGSSNDIEKEISIEEKTEDYTILDCKNVCDEAYSTQIQTDVCSGNCYYYKSHTKELDRYVESVKNTHKRNQQLNNLGGNDGK